MEKIMRNYATDYKCYKDAETVMGEMGKFVVAWNPVDAIADDPCFEVESAISTDGGVIVASSR